MRANKITFCAVLLLSCQNQGPISRSETNSDTPLHEDIERGRHDSHSDNFVEEWSLGPNTQHDSSNKQVLREYLRIGREFEIFFFNAIKLKGLAVQMVLTPQVSKVVQYYTSQDSLAELTSIWIKEGKLQILHFSAGKTCWANYYFNNTKLRIIRDSASIAWFADPCGGGRILPYRDCKYYTIKGKPELLLIRGEPDRWVGTAHENDMCQLVDIRKRIIYEFVGLDNTIIDTNQL